MLREADTNGDGRIRWAGGGWGVAAPALPRLLPSTPLAPVLVCTDCEARAGSWRCFLLGLPGPLCPLPFHLPTA